MTWLEKLLPTSKVVFIIIASLWGLTTLSGLESTAKIISSQMIQIQDQYVGLQLAVSELVKSLEITNSQVELQNTLLNKNQAAVVKLLEDQQEQIDGLIKFLVKTQPNHKAILQSYFGRNLKVE